eukprot:Colp12_sorted_trinity150504_noHs@7481
MFQSRYISDEGVEALKSYKYNGSNNSLLYNMLTRKIAIACVEQLPKTIAPNVITLVGLAFSIVSFFLMFYYSPDMASPVPNWVYVVCALNLFLYNTLDNMDGQQARRTGTSSPLGQLFDHGCDAVNTTISSVAFACAVRLGPIWAIGLWIPTCLAFYSATWSEFYTGQMYFPAFSGADEGVALTSALYLFTAAVGSDVWLQPVPGFTTFTYNKAACLLLVVGSLITAYGDITRVQRDRNPRFTFNEALSRLIPFGVLAILALLLTQKNIGVFFWLEYLSMGLVFAYIVCNLILAHVTHQEFHIFQDSLIIMFLVLGNRYLGEALIGGAIIPEPSAMVLFFGFVVAMYGHYTRGVIGEITFALNINCLTIRPPEIIA